MVEINYDQMEKFCGNVIEVENDRGLPVLALSTQVWRRACVFFEELCKVYLSRKKMSCHVIAVLLT